jgi:hypothetical protein
VLLVIWSIGLGVMFEEIEREIGGGWFLLYMGGMIFWLVLAVIFNSLMIKPSLITDDDLRLKGLSPEFVTAAQEHLKFAEFEDEDDNDDDSPRRRRRD